MSIKVDMTSTDLDRQIALMKFYPEVMKKHFRPRMYKATYKLAARIRPNIPTDTGAALAAFRSSVSGTGVNMTGRVGWFGKATTWYINVVEYGAKPHKIESFAPKAGVYIGNHPGFAGRGFMAEGFAAEQDGIESEMAAASEAVVNEMAVK